MVFMGMGFELVVLILAGAYAGDMIDKHFGWKGYASAALIVLFLISWFYHLMVLLKKVNEDEEKNENL
jgi:F0F1-type ATP synthase assembly protein I